LVNPVKGSFLQKKAIFNPSNQKISGIGLEINRVIVGLGPFLKEGQKHAWVKAISFVTKRTFLIFENIVNGLIMFLFFSRKHLQLDLEICGTDMD